MAEVVAADPQTHVMVLLRQAGVMIGLAASVALGFYVVMWARTPNFAVLYTDLHDRDLSQVVEELQSHDIAYRMDHRGGVILVDSARVHDARLKLAAAGLPKSADMGFEMLQENQGFGTSQFLEQARYQHAVEGELSRSISHINNVRAARVHLAIPKQSAFARTRRDPSASVIVDLYNGRRLEPHQSAAIVHMVSAAVPGLSPRGVTVIDQRGNLLTDAHGGTDDLVLTAKRFEYTRRLEKSYIQRVEAILAPLVGIDGVHAEVTADLDFTATEQTRESFNPDLPAVRSESLLVEERHGSAVGGVPGALTNEPPSVAAAPEVTTDVEEGTGAPPPMPSNRRNQTTRNYELDRTISHTKPAVGSLRRLSVAVVVRNPTPPPAAGTAAAQSAAPESEPLSEAQLARMTHLVKEAIGFDATRGDSVSVTSADFLKPETPEPLPELPIWKQDWVLSAGKQVLGGAFALFILLGVIRPAMKSLLAKPMHVTALAGGAGAGLTALPQGGDAQAAQPTQPALSYAEQASSGQALLPSGAGEPSLDQVKQYVSQDPKVAAQVVKGWVGD
ncbi:MAG: flagellar basal-body MS-ring/collar protein FliF [Gammaproteobacteria bacterium]|nr:flagellar basal-body MS-ring/collar protein FliF [Gammaproteobacteria bacterium]